MMTSFLPAAAFAASGAETASCVASRVCRSCDALSQIARIIDGSARSWPCRSAGMECDLEAIDQTTGRIIAAGIAIHRSLGPGLLESAYLGCMVIELREAGLDFELQRRLPLTYKNIEVDCAFRVD